MLLLQKKYTKHSSQELMIRNVHWETCTVTLIHKKVLLVTVLKLDKTQSTNPYKEGKILDSTELDETSAVHS